MTHASTNPASRRVAGAAAHRSMHQSSTRNATLVGGTCITSDTAFRPSRNNLVATLHMLFWR
jgi:hypothetical protein